MHETTLTDGNDSGDMLLNERSLQERAGNRKMQGRLFVEQRFVG
jgi:hypothetical protein